MRIQLLPLALAAVTAAAAHAKPAALSPYAAFKADFLKQADDVEKKLTDLVEATPQDKLAYKPDAVTRTFAEVFLHVAGANYFFGGFFGFKPPDSFTKDYEKSTTDKAKIAAELKASFAWLKENVSKLSDGELRKTVKFFGNDRAKSSLLFFAANHMHEHLGQAIAYARANGVTPPWSKGKE